MVCIGCGHRLAELRRKSERASRGQLNAAGIWGGDAVGWKHIVGLGDVGSRLAESLTQRAFQRVVVDESESASQDDLRSHLISCAKTRLVVRKLLSDGKAAWRRRRTHKGQAAIQVQRGCGALQRGCAGGAEGRIQPVVAICKRGLIVPANTGIHGQLAGDAPIVLQIECEILLLQRISNLVGVVSAGRITQQHGRDRVSRGCVVADGAVWGWAVGAGLAAGILLRELTIEDEVPETASRVLYVIAAHVAIESHAQRMLFNGLGDQQRG